MARLERAAYRFGLRPWEVARMSPGTLAVWVAAHMEPQRDTRSNAEKIAVLWDKMGWELHGQ